MSRVNLKETQRREEMINEQTFGDEREYLTNKIGFFCRAKRIGFYKKTEFKKLFFEGLFFFVFLKKRKCENLIYFKDKYM